MAHVAQRPTIAKLIDELGDVIEQRKHLDIREAALKDALKRYGAGTYRGKLYDAMLFEKTRHFYKMELLKQHVSVEVLKRCEVITPYLEVKLQRKTQLRAI